MPQERAPLLTFWMDGGLVFQIRTHDHTPKRNYRTHEHSQDATRGPRTTPKMELFPVDTSTSSFRPPQALYTYQIPTLLLLTGC